MRRRGAGGVTVLSYIAFFNPFFVIVTAILAMLVTASLTGEVPFLQSRLWQEQWHWCVLFLAVYFTWIVQLWRKSSRAAVIIGSKSIYLNTFKKRFSIDEVGVTPYSKIPGGIEEVSILSQSFSTSFLTYAKRHYFAPGFLRLFFPLSDALNRHAPEKLLARRAGQVYGHSPTAKREKEAG